MSVSRRQFLRYVGMGSAALLADPGRGRVAAAAAGRGRPPAFFEPIVPSTRDELILPRGFDYSVVAKWGDALGSNGPNGYGPEKFGFNNDLLVYFPINALSGGGRPNSEEGLLWVNHEYPNPLFVGRYRGGRKTEEQILAEKLCVGGSVIHVARRDGRWTVVRPSRYTRRLTALYPRIETTGPASAAVPFGTGTLANCSGGKTPWHTALSCEENYHDYNANVGLRWGDVEGQAIDENQYGWVVEVDPFGELPPAKHTALGRFAHENTAWRLGPTGRLVVYMGDDANDQHFYKYVSNEPYRDGDTREQKRRLLSDGVLYAADFAAGRWIPLVFGRTRGLSAPAFRDQADVLIRCREAALAVGATRLDRPEDCEVHPGDGSVYIALTNNAAHGNYYGQVVRLVEENDDAEGGLFRYEIFLAGGPQSGLACPDNLAFDRAGNLWVVCDISSGALGRGAYRGFGNNGLFVVPTRGESAGDAFQFASGPVECELTGPWFTDDEETLFLSVQHPGENSTALDGNGLTSHWPDGGSAIPRPAVVAITGFRNGTG